MSIVDTMKDVVSLVRKLDNIDILKQVLELQGQVFELQDENKTLKLEVNNLSAKLQFSQSLKYSHPFYYATEDAIPYCPRCWEAERKAIHLKDDWNKRRWECYSCKNVYLLDDTAPPTIMFETIR